jgi:hypothetical protein
MSQTTFSGPVASQNGFIGGTSTSPIAVTTASNVNSSYATTSATTGDTRLSYNKLTFTSTGSGETARFFSVVSGASAATAGTINGAHISCEVNTGGTISGAANALRATLGGSATSPGGTLAVLQLDTNYTANVSLPATAAFIRVSDSGTNTGEVPNLLNIEAGPAATIVSSGAATAGGTIKKIKILIDGTTYYIQAATSFS